jgi:hypothetical protein
MRPGIQITAGVVVALALALVLVPAPAAGHGAFPDSESLLTPPERPDEIVLVLNFGLLLTSDGGKSWLWSCEHLANELGRFYQLGPLPRHRLYAVANNRLIYTADRSCSWQIVGGAIADVRVIHAFVDPVRPDWVLVAGTRSGADLVLDSADGGESFDVRYTTAPGDFVINVERARSDPLTIYAALQSGPMFLPALARSTDGGASWQVINLFAMGGPGTVRIIAIDPDNPRKLFLRWSGASGDAVAVSEDGGDTVTKTLTASTGLFTAFVRAPSGALLVGGTVDSAPALFRSRNGGATFERAPDPPPLRALSEREGRIYAASDNFTSGWVVGSTVDEGDSWQPVVSFAEVRGIVGCGMLACQAECQKLVTMLIWPAAVCEAKVDAGVTTPADAGGAGTGGEPGGEGAGGGGGGAGGKGGGAGGGCGCAVDGLPFAGAGPALAALAASLLLRARRRERERERERSG